MYSLDKEMALNLIWQYSKFFGQNIDTCEQLFKNDEGYVSLILLFETTENICKSIIENYNLSFFDVVVELKKLNMINKREEQILSTGEFSIRKIRNLFAHADLSNLGFFENGVYYSLQESETCLLLYAKIFPSCVEIITNLIKRKLLE